MEQAKHFQRYLFYFTFTDGSTYKVFTNGEPQLDFVNEYTLKLTDEKGNIRLIGLPSLRHAVAFPSRSPYASRQSEDPRITPAEFDGLDD